MPTLNQNSEASGHYKIVDAPKVVGLLILSLIFIGGGIIGAIAGLVGIVEILAGKAHAGNLPEVIGGVIAVTIVTALAFLLGFFLFKAFQVTSKGFVVDVAADTLEFPGGGIAADSASSYLSSGYWLQYINRYTLVISKIRQVHPYSQTETSVSDSGKVSSDTTHYLDINGAFGAIQFSFVTKGKRDELYSLLVQMNQMGKPILNR
jgi:hypothetical protein